MSARPLALAAALAALVLALPAALPAYADEPPPTTVPTTPTPGPAPTPTPSPTPALPAPPQAKTLYQDGPSGRYLLDGAWLFQSDPADPAAAARLPIDPSTASWTPVQVPNAFNAGDDSLLSYLGSVVWYRKDFTLPSAAAALRWIVRFESVNYAAQVWLNGERIGSHTGAFLPWELNLPKLSRRGINRLVIRIDNRHTASDLPPGGRGDDGVGALAGGWWNYGGILREVYLRRVDRVDFQQVIVRPSLPCPRCSATVAETAILRNVTSVPQRAHLVSRYGGASLDLGTAIVPAGGTRTLTATIPIAHPRLWSIVRPALYRVSFTLTAGGLHDRRLQRVGSYTLHSGIRSIVVTKSGRLLLNGQQIHLRGFGLHEDNPLLGAALTPAFRERDVAWIKQLGATIIRSHYPLHPEFYELADRLGILIWSEIPVYQLSSADLASPHAKTLADQFLRTNIATNQNHASTLLWSVGNELRYQAGGVEAAYYRHATALAHQLDPTRPVAAAVGTYPGIGCQSAYAPLDAIGFNDYFGWYSGALGSIADRDALSSYLDEFRACYPHKAIFVSEFGFEANRDGPVEEKGTYEFQQDSLDYHLGVFATKPWLAGAIYWALQDFRVRPGWSGGNPQPTPPWHRKGLLDESGAPKPAFSDVQRIYRGTRQLGP
jgi:beta-glucuronidase